jgi:hypothetical protein
VKEKKFSLLCAVFSCIFFIGQCASPAAAQKQPDEYLDLQNFNKTFGSNYLDQYFYWDIVERNRMLQGSGRDIFDYGLYEDTAYVYLLAVGITAVLYFSPKEVSQWDDDEKEIGLMKISGRYWDNITGGPVIDSDKFAINYLGHPYFGAVYYTRARHLKKSPQQSLAFSFFMSTFVYEHGIEAFFEKPSIQDMIITPVFGAILGELFLDLEDFILHNNRKLLHSKTLGELCLFLIDPLQEIIDPMKVFLGEDLKLRIRKEFTWLNPSFNEDGQFPGDEESVKKHVYGLKFVLYREAL